jgi:adenosine deaminase
MLPVAELHIHIEGTLEPELLVKLARRNGTWMPTLEVGELRAQYRFDGLQSFLDLHYANLRVLKIEQDFYDLARAYLARAAAAGVRRAEIFFDPQTHLANGVPLEEVFGGLTAALADGARDHGISADLIPCFLRDLGAGAAGAVLRACLPFRDQIIGVGLDSDERSNPPVKFASVFEQARAEGYRLTMHCDVDQKDSIGHIRQCLELIGVERIDHGVNILESPELCELVRRQRIGLTACPISNRWVAGDLKAKEVRRLLELEILVTVNSDDPAYFGGYVTDNLIATQAAADLSREDAIRLQRNAIEMCWAPPPVRGKLLEELDAYLAGSAGAAPG